MVHWGGKERYVRELARKLYGFLGRIKRETLVLVIELRVCLVCGLARERRAMWGPKPR